MADIHSAKSTACSINYVCTLKYNLLNLYKVDALCSACDAGKKMQLYLNVFLLYLNICLSGHILTKCNLISMDLGEPGPQDFSTVGQLIVFTVLGWQLHLLWMNINSPLSISMFRIFPLFHCPDVSHVISR